jgi:hypothetical protein
MAVRKGRRSWLDQRLIEIEQVVKEGTAPTGPSFTISVPIGIKVVIIVAIVPAVLAVAAIVNGPARRERLRWLSQIARGSARGGRGVGLPRPFDQLVQLPPVEPDAAAPGAVVDLNSLTFGDVQLRTVDRAFHETYLRKLLRRSGWITGSARAD